MPSIKDRLRLAYEKMTDDEARVERDRVRHERKIQKIKDKQARVAAEAELKVEVMKRKEEITKAKATLRDAQIDKSLAGIALNKARQAHARSVLGWAGLIIKPISISPKTQKQVKITAKKAGSAVGKWWGKIGQEKPKPKAKPKAKPTTKRTTKKRGGK